jgi:hypothetical protein
MERRIVLLGYGMQGKACVYDLINHGEFDELVIVDCYEGFLGDISALEDSRIKGCNIDGTDLVKIRELLPSASSGDRTRNFGGARGVAARRVREWS